MDLFNPWSLIVGTIASAVGIGAFLYGKRSGDMKALLVGILMAASPYFLPGFWLLAAFLVLLAVLFAEKILQRLGGGPAPIEEIPPPKKSAADRSRRLGGKPPSR